MSFYVIETARLVLRPAAELDIPELLPLIGAREVAATTLRIPHPYEKRHAREFLASPAKENELRLLIRLRCELKLNRIYAAHFSGNDASGRVLQKLGMQYEGRMRQALWKQDRFIDVERYAILRDDIIKKPE